MLVSLYAWHSLQSTFDKLCVRQQADVNFDLGILNPTPHETVYLTYWYHRTSSWPWKIKCLNIMPTLTWEERYKKLCEYHSVHNNCKVSKQHDKGLYNWINNQKKQYRFLGRNQKSTFLNREDRIEKLNKLNFQWKSTGTCRKKALDHQIQWTRSLQEGAWSNNKGRKQNSLYVVS